MDHFDPESGQVYRERIVKREKSNFREWHHAYKGRKPSNVRSPRGADNLTGMVLRKLVCHADQLTPQALAPLPATTAHQIRKAIRREGCETLDIFKSFAESGHEDNTYRFATSAINFYKPLANFFLDLVSPGFSWMVDLNLSNLYCSPLDLRQLSTLDNLQTLLIHYSKVTGEEPFDDDVLNHLSFRASTDNALSKLTMIFVSNAAGISRHAIPCISRFPSLETFCVVGTGINAKDVRQRTTSGWVISKDPIFRTDGDERSARETYDWMLHDLSFPERVVQFIQKRRSSESTGLWTLPSADVFFGRSQLGFKGSRGYSTDIYCFERDVKLSKRGSDSAAEAPKRKVGQSGSDCSTISRKVKATKTVRLDTMLEGFEGV